jgi:acylphosphatase
VSAVRNDAIAARVVVAGRVQGVGFRAATERQARRAGLVGWVRNTPEGAVEAFVQGSPFDVAKLVEWMRTGGPPLGRVEHCDVTSTAVDASLTAFDVRRA